MIEYITGTLLICTAVIVFCASVGILRFNNLYARMHVVTKVSSFGVLLLLIAINIYEGNMVTLIKTLLIFHVLVFLSPIAAHVTAKVARWLYPDIFSTYNGSEEHEP